MPTPTQMFEGIQFHLLLGETITTSCLLPSFFFARRAAVCPAIPALSISKRAIIPPTIYVQEYAIKSLTKYVVKELEKLNKNFNGIEVYFLQ